MAQEYVLDGYNVIYSSQQFEASDLKGSRDRLIQFLREERPQGSARNQVTVVFDGKPGFWQEAQAVSSIKAVFTEDNDADQWIKQYVENAANPRNIVVVSNDREIIVYVRKLMANVLSVEDFLVKSRCRRKVSGKVKKSVQSAEQKQISYTDEASINREMKTIWLNKGSQT